MGACSLNQNVSKNQLTQFSEEIVDDYHMVSSRIVMRNDRNVFIQPDILPVKQSNLKTMKFTKNTPTPEDTFSDPLKTIEDLKIPTDTKMKQTVEKEKSNPPTAEPIAQPEKQNSQISVRKSQKRKKTLVNTGNFLKIKEKQACSEYKVLAKIANKMGELYKVLDKTTNQTRSLEIIPEDKASQQTLHEINLLKRLDHPNIYHLYDVFLKKNFYYVIGEYIEGDNIFCLTKENEVITEKKLSKLIREIFQALNYLHFRGIMHRNIKPQTIVFESKLKKNEANFPAIKLINFKKATEIKLTKQEVGNHYFMAPEMIIGSHNEKCDIWSVGVILYLLVSGEVPFPGDTKEQIQKSITGRDLNFKEKIWETRSDSLKQFLRQLLHKSPSKRISAQQALNHKWFTEASDNIQILLSKKSMQNLLHIGKDSKFKTIIKTYLVKMTTSLEERQDMARKFQSIDKDKSGFLDKNELIAAYREIHGHDISENIDLDDILEKIDINRSGLIDFSEFMAAVCRVETLFAKDRLEKAFDFIDNDGTGEIEISELIQLLSDEMENEGELAEEDEEIADILREFDHDGDKTISKEEFINFFLKLKDASKMRNSLNLQVDMTV